MAYIMEDDSMSTNLGSLWLTKQYSWLVQISWKF